jgi:hypothetical protein
MRLIQSISYDILIRNYVIQLIRENVLLNTTHIHIRTCSCN